MIYFGPAIIGLIFFFVLWLVFGLFWVGVIGGILIALISGGISIGRGGRGNTTRIG